MKQVIGSAVRAKFRGFPTDTFRLCHAGRPQARSLERLAMVSSQAVNSYGQTASYVGPEGTNFARGRS